MPPAASSVRLSSYGAQPAQFRVEYRTAFAYDIRRRSTMRSHTGYSASILCHCVIFAHDKPFPTGLTVFLDDHQPCNDSADFDSVRLLHLHARRCKFLAIHLKSARSDVSHCYEQISYLECSEDCQRSTDLLGCPVGVLRLGQSMGCIPLLMGARR